MSLFEMLFGLLFIITKNPIVALKVAYFSFIHIPEMDISPHINVHPIIVDRVRNKPMGS